MFNFAEKNGSQVFTFLKRMGTEECYECQGEIYEKIKGSKIPVVFDLADVTYVASIFLSMCIGVLKEAGAQNFSIINVHPDVKKVFKIARLDERITIT